MGKSCPRRPPGSRRGPREDRPMTITTKAFVLCLATTTLGSGSALAQAQATPPAASTPKPASLGLAVYPGSGQDAAQQSKDENECYSWARQQTGIDPTAAPAPVAAPEKQRGGA